MSSLIMADHWRVRLREVLDSAVRRGPAVGSGWTLVHVWGRLAELLQAHMAAEEGAARAVLATSSDHLDRENVT